jgi:hypothetical protein
MRTEGYFALGTLALIVILTGAAVWLANAPLHPQIQQAHLQMSDERIPR